MAGHADVVSEATFAPLMDRLGPFETAPHIAVAVSGGGDSMALLLLLDGWTRMRGGRLTALTVDHGLRPQSSAESAGVAGWAADRGLAHHILPWSGAKPTRAIQERARQARYDLLETWCRQNGVLHLAVAHTLDDQAETFLMRLNRGSGPDGLAGMSAVVDKPHCRLLRPLLTVSRHALRRFLVARGTRWLDDPSNQDERFERVRWRRSIAACGLSAPALARAAARYGQARTAFEAETAKAIARTVRLHPFGFVRGDIAALRALPGDLFCRVLARVLVTVGATDHAPGRGKLDDLVGRLRTDDEAAATLGRCRIKTGGGTLLVCREARHLPERCAVTAGSALTWGRRYRLRVGPARSLAERELWITALGRRGPDSKGADWLRSAAPAVPRMALPSLPALADERGIVEVPHLGYRRAAGSNIPPVIRSIAFAPPNSLSGRGFFVA